MPSTPTTPKVQYVRREPEHTALYRLVHQFGDKVLAEVEEAGDGARLPKFVRKALEAYKKCGQLKHGAAELLCDDCRGAELIAFSCKRRGLCVSCDGRRMTEEAALSRTLRQAQGRPEPVA